ncbi:NAD-dependent epimerase/dehydratase family protein [Paenibacillus sp. SI8]|uniref:NAD-dependent epimerase/dehydratase family protein n=1 Tax=unclassified Paenibacillus TaxID=185978 RepID=UPI003465E5A0
MNDNLSARTTVIGAQGFIGQHIVKALESFQLACFAPEKGDSALFREPLGRVIYCAGVTSDFRQRPFDTMRSHVSFLSELLEKATFNSFVYVSSTRIYLGCSHADERATLAVNPQDPDHLFHLSKLAGETLCLHAGRPNVKIARVSNVCGDDYNSGNFLYALLRDALESGRIELHTTLNSSKDYIGVEDVAKLLIQISEAGKSRIYNVASGVNTSNREIVEWIIELTGCEVTVADSARTIIFPEIAINLIRNEFDFKASDSGALIQKLAEKYMKHAGQMKERNVD